MLTGAAQANYASYAAALKALLPPNARRLLQVGWRDATLAAAYKHTYPASVWQVVERDAEAAAQARRHCDLVHQANVDTVGAPFFAHMAMADAWIFDHTLADSADPQALLRHIRAVIPADASLFVVLPNLPVWPHPGASREHGLEAVQAMLWQAGFVVAEPRLLALSDAGGTAPLLLLASPA